MTASARFARAKHLPWAASYVSADSRQLYSVVRALSTTDITDRCD